MRVSAILFVLLFFIEAVPADTKQLRVILDLRASRAEIRTALLKYTPPSSRIEYVVRFISERLERRESASAITVQPIKDAARPGVAKTIHVYLGHYYKHLGAVFLTAPMIVHEDVSAQWLFDPNGRLLDIMVDKQGRVY